MKRIFSLCLAALIAACQVSAVEFGEVRVAEKRITICRVDVGKEKLQLFLKDGRGEHFKRLDKLAKEVEAQGKKLRFAMNAGMFEADFSPVGLLVAEGKEVHSLNTTNGTGNFFLKPNGVFLVTDKGGQVVDS